MKKTCLAICGIVFLLNSGCVSLIEKAGQTIDRSAIKEKQTAIYRTAKSSNDQADESARLSMEIRVMQNKKTKEQSITITLEQFPTMKLRGSVPNERGEFFLTSLDYLGGSVHGWNEYRMDIFGSGSLILGDTTAWLSIPDEILPVQISSGRIRRYDTRITGNDALANLRNRRERILALTEWLNAPPGETDYSLNRPGDLLESGNPAIMDLDEFEEYWKPVLFPETARKRNRPENWQQDGDQWVSAEGIRWNSGYTERAFPQELWAIRNSGTMLRDWEEALDWIFNEYEWGRITEILAQETVLNKARR